MFSPLFSHSAKIRRTPKGQSRITCTLAPPKGGHQAGGRRQGAFQAAGGRKAAPFSAVRKRPLSAGHLCPGQGKPPALNCRTPLSHCRAFTGRAPFHRGDRGSTRNSRASPHSGRSLRHPSASAKKRSPHFPPVPRALKGTSQGEPPPFRGAAGRPLCSCRPPSPPTPPAQAATHLKTPAFSSKKELPHQHFCRRESSF